MMFRVAWYRTRSVAISFIVGILSSLALSELLYEQIIYSETLCTFFVVLSMLAFVRIDAGSRLAIEELCAARNRGGARGHDAPAVSVLGPLYFCFMLARGRMRSALALVLAPTLVLAIGWSAFNRHAIGYFGVTTTTGFNLSNHSGAFMELAPPQYSPIADIYLRYRAWQIPRMGSQTMTIWYAEDEIKRTTGLSTAQLSKQTHANVAGDVRGASAALSGIGIARMDALLGLRILRFRRRLQRFGGKRLTRCCSPLDRFN